MSSKKKDNDMKVALEETPLNSEKLPYTKPELHLLNLDGTEGKSTTVPTETTVTSLSGPS